jgi:hypothetical protein
LTTSDPSSRIFLANVGVNASHRFASPLFDDGSFEFITIPETPADIRGENIVRYRDLKSFHDPNCDLTKYIPARLWDIPTHNDPEFETLTYGDNCGWSPRAAALKGMVPGDCLFFIVRLERWRSSSPTGEFGFYLIGFLEIEEVFANVTERPDGAAMNCIGRNAHVRRGLTNQKYLDGFWVFAGSQNSRRFKKAVPVTRDLCEQVFVAADGTPWRWEGGRTDLQVIGSYTRSCRCVINPAISGQGERAGRFWEWIDACSV